MLYYIAFSGLFMNPHIAEFTIESGSSQILISDFHSFRFHVLNSELTQDVATKRFWCVDVAWCFI